MEPKEWIALGSLSVAIITLFISYFMQLRQERLRIREREVEQKLKLEEKKIELLYTKRAEVLSDVYALLDEFRNDIRIFPYLANAHIENVIENSASSDEDWSELDSMIDDYLEKENTCKSKILKNKVWLSPDLAGRINKLLSLLDKVPEVYMHFSLSKDLERLKREIEELDHDENMSIVDDILEEIEKEFRVMLGSYEKNNL